MKIGEKINFNRNSYTLGIDLNTFHPDYQKLQIIEQLISTYGQSNNKRQNKRRDGFMCQIPTCAFVIHSFYQLILLLLLLFKTTIIYISIH